MGRFLVASAGWVVVVTGYGVMALLMHGGFEVPVVGGELHVGIGFDEARERPALLLWMTV
jgi:hypothetical protein